MAAARVAAPYSVEAQKIWVVPGIRRPPPAVVTRRRSRRSLDARSMSIESSASPSTSCGMRFMAAALIDRSCLATAGSNLSSLERWWAMIAQ